MPKNARIIPMSKQVIPTETSRPTDTPIPTAIETSSEPDITSTPAPTIVVADNPTTTAASQPTPKPTVEPTVTPESTIAPTITEPSEPLIYIVPMPGLVTGLIFHSHETLPVSFAVLADKHHPVLTIPFGIL